LVKKNEFLKNNLPKYKNCTYRQTFDAIASFKKNKYPQLYFHFQKIKKMNLQREFLKANHNRKEQRETFG